MLKKENNSHHNSTKKMYRVLDTWIDITAPLPKVWEMLVDFKMWELWNPFIPIVVGKLQIGEKMYIKVVPPGLKPKVFKPEVYEVKKYEKILWGGSFLWIIYRGDHAFLLKPLPGGKTRFQQIERFQGPLVLLMGGMIKKTELGYQQMNLAFKKHVEENK